MTRPLPDSQARCQAVLTSSHAFVWAGAGTGKTHTLTLRALHLLLNAPFLTSGEDSIDLYRSPEREKRLRAARRIVRSLVLTTFTRKAAAEMQTRLFAYLDRLSRPPQEPLDSNDALLGEVVSRAVSNLESARLGEAPQRLQQGASVLAELAAELQVSTLHSYAASILRRHPLQAGIPPRARFAQEDESDLAGLPRQIVEIWWRRQALSDPDLEAELSQVLRTVPLEHVNRWLEMAVEHPWVGSEGGRRQEAGGRKSGEGGGRRETGDGKTGDLEGALEACRGLVEAVGRVGGRGSVQAWKEFAGRVDSAVAGQDRALTELHRFLRRHPRFFLDGDPYAVLQRALPELSEKQRYYFQRRSQLDRLIVYAALRIEWPEAWQAWQRVLKRFADWACNASVRELGLVTFDDMIRLAVELLEGHPKIRRMERERLQDLLVDEFQDTDPDQLRLLSCLLRRDNRQDHEVLGFFVGDLKQSIYRFRGADLQSIRRFHQDYPRLACLPSPPESYQLTTSFRSLPPVIDFVNSFFREQVPLTHREEELAAYRGKKEAGEEKEAGGRRQEAGRGEQMTLPLQGGEQGRDVPEWVLVQEEGGGELNAEKERRLLAWETVRCIRELRDGGAEFRDISVLVRKERELGPLLEALQEAAIPAVSSGARTFYRRPEVLDLLSLLIACHHPGDSLATAALLRSPVVALDDRWLDRLSSAIRKGSLLHTDAPLPGKLPSPQRQRIESLRQLVARRIEMDTSSWLDRVRLVFPAGAYLHPQDREGRCLMRIDRLLERYRLTVEGGRKPPLLWLLEQRRRADRGDDFDADLGEDVSAADESVDALRVLTVHKAKGLENRLVIVYGWQAVLEDMRGDFPGGKIPSLLDLMHPQGFRLREFRLPWGPLQIETAGFEQGLEAERENNRQEAMRLAYVAATRARDRLILISAHPFRCPLPDPLQEFMEDALAELQGPPSQSSALSCEETLRLRLRSAQRPLHKEEAGPSPPYRPERYRALWERRRTALSVEERLWHSPTDSEHAGEREWSEPQESAAEEPQHPSDRAAGILVHRYLELHLHQQGFQPHLLDRICRFETFPPDSQQSAAEILDRFCSGQTCDPQGRPYKQRLQECRILARELPVYLQVECKPWYGVIDLVLETGSGILGVDYKTASPRSPLPTHYVRQLDIYSQALRRLYPKAEVSFELWWLGPSE